VALTETLHASGHAVIGTTRRREQAVQADVAFLDLAAPDLDALPQADIAVICATMARFEDCRTKPDLARQVNVTAPAAIAEQMRKEGKRVLLLSSSVVFDCLAPKRRADEDYSPRSAYGRLKADAERAVLSLGEGMAVLRLTKVVRATDGIFPGWIATLSQGRSITAFGRCR
jgi:dTDP-4-dehydrorhamnose reductase